METQGITEESLSDTLDSGTQDRGAHDRDSLIHCGDGPWCETCETRDDPTVAKASGRGMARNALGRCDDYMGDDQKQIAITAADRPKAA